MLARCRQCHATNFHMTRNEIKDSRPATTVRDVHELYLLFGGHVFGAHVSNRSDARSNVVYGIFLSLHQLQEILECFNGGGGIFFVNNTATTEIGDVSEVAD